MKNLHKSKQHKKVLKIQDDINKNLSPLFDPLRKELDGVTAEKKSLQRSIYKLEDADDWTEIRQRKQLKKQLAGVERKVNDLVNKLDDLEAKTEAKREQQRELKRELMAVYLKQVDKPHAEMMDHINKAVELCEELKEYSVDLFDIIPINRSDFELPRIEKLLYLKDYFQEHDQRFNQTVKEHQK